MICDLPSSTLNANETSRGPLAQARAFEPRADALLQPAEDGALMASTSVFVVEPGSPIGKKIHMDIFLCSSMQKFRFNL